MAIYDELRKLEEIIDQGFPILGIFRVCNGKALAEQIRTIEQELPQEILRDRVNLIKSGKGEIFKHIESMQQIFERSFMLFGAYALIDSNKIFHLVDLIYAEVPTTIASTKGERAELYKKIEIPDFLKKNS